MQLVIMNIDGENATSGVTRYVQMLLAGLGRYRCVQVIYIHLMNSTTLIYPKRIYRGSCLEILIPLPLGRNNIIREQYWNDGYNAFIFKYFSDVLRDGCILHLQYVNLIGLALYIKSRIPCKIIAHLHCIPWKSLYGRDPKRFNMLYYAVNGGNGQGLKPDDFAQIACEMDYYHRSDYVVCVTKCAADFLVDYMKVPASKIRVIYNGLEDSCLGDGHQPGRTEFGGRLLYVGVLSPSKGLNYILDAVRLVRQEGLDVELVVAGSYTPLIRDRIYHDYSDIPVRLEGLIPYEDLRKLYKNCDAGIIASLQEQCSYAAIEMLMHGMPVISTMIDGLGEIFEDGKSGLKVNTVFSPVLGLSVDVRQMARQISRLSSDGQLRESLRMEGRLRYENAFTLQKMMKDLVDLYNEM